MSVTKNSNPSLQAQIEALPTVSTRAIVMADQNGSKAFGHNPSWVKASDLLALLASIPAQEPDKEAWRKLNDMLNLGGMTDSWFIVGQIESVLECQRWEHRKLAHLQDRDAELTCALQVAEEQVSSLKRQQALMAEAHRAEVVALRDQLQQILSDNGINMNKVIKVPDLEGPTKQLCWKQAPHMVRCDRMLNHAGMHSWEYFAKIKELEAKLGAIE